MGLIPVRRAGRDEQLSIVDHLHELRTRIIISLAAVVVSFFALYAVRTDLLDLLKAPLPERHRESGLITLSPTEPFFTTLKVCFWAAVLVSIPVWLYQLYAFLIPAVRDQSRRLMLLVVAAISALFLAGVAFGYYVVLPVALDFLLGFGGDSFNEQVRAGEYYGFATALLLGSGLLFEVPAAMLGFAVLGLVTADQYIAHWRIALVAIAFLAAILPGGDPFSMFLLMIPQIALYSLGVVLARRYGRPSLWRGPDSDQQPPPTGG